MGCGGINPIVGFRGFNLVQNPSFEAGLASWISNDNVSTSDIIPFEGTQVAFMDANVASMYQDVVLAGTDCSPLFLSFNVISVNQPKLTVDVLWLDNNHNFIATGLKMFISRGITDGVNNSRITFFDITDNPPPGTAFARLIISKAEGEEESSVSIDQVIMAPVGSINLLENPSFEAGLTGWTTTTYIPDFETPLQGANNIASILGGSLYQDVPIDTQPPNSSYLFSFGASGHMSGTLEVQVLWLDAGDNIIGSPGLEIIIPSETLPRQENYLTYLDLTEPAPDNAVKARILFESSLGEGSVIRIDQVIFARAGSPNLIINPSFEDGLNNWAAVGVSAVASNETYEGDFRASFEINGASLFQDVAIDNGEGHCFLFNCGLRVEREGGGIATTDIVVRVLWLDDRGREIGLGLSLVAFSTANPGVVFPQWLVYTGITESAPPGAAAARVQFTKLLDVNAFVSVDKIVFGRLA
ncbi:MAG: hypothetical protein GX201_07550 [Clostridiales bacterium]|nr:hypothetical protein [Clostridiales bacterium]